MAFITALVHTENDALRLGRALETLYACDDILIVDHGSRDDTLRVARQYGARVVGATSGAALEEYCRLAAPGWVLCLDPREALTEKLAASLFEWKSETISEKGSGAHAFSVFLREETVEGWMDHPAAQTRLVPRNWNWWNEKFPAYDPSALTLEGELLRFAFP
jgi:glycosyltransferase involved in cell wall biosynthesis